MQKLCEEMLLFKLDFFNAIRIKEYLYSNVSLFFPTRNEIAGVTIKIQYLSYVIR